MLLKTLMSQKNATEEMLREKPALTHSQRASTGGSLPRHKGWPCTYGVLLPTAQIGDQSTGVVAGLAPQPDQLRAFATSRMCKVPALGSTGNRMQQA